MDSEKNQDRTKPIRYYGLMTLPIRQWFEYIITDYKIISQDTGNSKIQFFAPDSLKAKAFSIWIYSAMDVLEKKKTIYDEFSRLKKYGLKFKIAEEHIKLLIIAIEESLSILTKEEQIFLRDRRLQNVHGFLSSYFIGEMKTKWFENEVVIIKKLPTEEYNNIMRKFYPRMVQNEDELVKRFLGNVTSKKLMVYWLEYIRSNQAYFGLLKQMSEELDIKINVNYG